VPITTCCHYFAAFHFRLDEAAAAMKREIDYYTRAESQGLVNKLVMGLVMIHLHRGDYVAADQAFKSCLNRLGHSGYFCRFKLIDFVTDYYGYN